MTGAEVRPRAEHLQIAGVRAVFLDLDDTLADSEARRRAACMGALRDLGEALRPDAAQAVANAYIQIFRDVARKNAWASCPRVQRFALAFRRNGIDDNDLSSRAADRYGHHQHDIVAFLPEAESLVQAATRVSTCLITNGNGATQRETARRLGLIDRLDHILISGEVGASKPDPAIFRQALDLVAAHPRVAVMIGDSLHTDIAGAAKLGIWTIWINHHGWPVDPSVPAPDLIVASPAEAAAALERATHPRSGA